MATTTTSFLGLTTNYGLQNPISYTDFNADVDAIEDAFASRTSISVTTANYTLSTTEYRNKIIYVSGTLTGNRNVVVPLTTGACWKFYNNTSGSYTLTIIGASGTGITITQGSSAIVYTDGTNVLRLTPDVNQDGTLAASSQTGAIANTVADANVIGGLTLTHRIDVAAGATGNVDVVFTYKSRVVDVRLVKKSAAGGGAGTIQVFNGTGGNAITDAMSINVNDKVVVRCAEIDDAYHEIAAGATVRVTRTRTASTDETCTVYIETIRVA